MCVCQIYRYQTVIMDDDVIKWKHFSRYWSFLRVFQRSPVNPIKQTMGRIFEVLFCLVRPGVRDKRRVSEIGLSQPRHEKAFWWRHNGSVTSQLTELQYFEQVLPV